MKKLNIFSLLLLFVALFTGCKDDSFTLTSELPQFELREGYMLLEVIVPYGTGINDDVYIIGDFNGGEAAVGDPTWKLQRGNPESGVPAKFGIYINPNSFANGKTLADGYTFYDVQKGPELDINGEPIYHYAYPQAGQRLNVFCDYWESDFKEAEVPEEVEHDGYAIFVIDHTGYEQLALYAWGDAEAFGGWPGMTPTGTQTINGTTYTYFDTGASNAGLNLNLIFNNNNNGEQLPDVNVDLNQDFYFELTPDGAVAIEPDQPEIEHDGFAVFVYSENDWEEVWLYMWGDQNDLNGAWPGYQPTGTATINGVAYLYFDLGEANTGLNENLIFNNGDNGEQANDFNFTIDRDVYVVLSGNNVTEIDPADFTPGGATEPEPEPEPEPDEPLASAEYRVYIQNETSWDNLYLYAYNGGENLYGAWPGMTFEQKTTIDGVEYMVFPLPATMESATLIFNNNDGTQVEQADMVVTLDQNWYIKVTDTEAAFLDIPEITLYVDNQTGWDAFALYSWGNGDVFGGWPGTVSNTTETIDGVDYIVYKAPATGNVENLIFNNNGGGTQLPDFGVTLNEDAYLIVTSEGVQFAGQ